MVFSSVAFIFYFLPAVLLFYYLSKKTYRNIILIVFSLLFYYWGGPKYIVVMLYSILINYILGILIDRYKGNITVKKTLLIVSVVLNLIVLMYFKYTNFFIQNINKLIVNDMALRNIIMPIGISFFTFKAISYTVDVYREDAKVQRNLLNLALYLTFFPQLLAGPIVRYQTVAGEIESRNENINDFSYGIERFLFGLAKKIILATGAGQLAEQIFALQLQNLSVLVAWLGAIAYTFQIYFDFSGYSDMALGLGKMFGFNFIENFNYPYIATTVSGFWRRWHISLTTWFKDYVYIPLGGNRVSQLKLIRNIFIVWLLTGFWHGASWNFIAWGLYFFIILMFEKIVLSKFIHRIWKPLLHVYTMLLVIVGWVLFRITSLRQALSYIKIMFGLDNRHAGIYEVSSYLTENWFVLILCIIFCMPIYDFLKEKIKAMNNKAALVIFAAKPVILIFIYFFSIMYTINSTFNPFIYFKF